jgi:hypothetical protein
MHRLAGFLPLIILLATAVCMGPQAKATLAEAQVGQPNVVYMLADDLGWGDLSCHGGSVPTPAIDGLFQSGIELTSFMSWCVCSPTRAMLLTGRHPFRVGTGPRVGGELPESETTIAEVFRAAGSSVQAVPYGQLQKRLVADGQRLTAAAP